MNGLQPTSVNVVGVQRIGKSSLLSHFAATWEQWSEAPKKFVVVVRDIKGITRQTAFYQLLEDELRQRLQIQHRNLVRTFPKKNKKDVEAFRSILRICAEGQLTPVFCLDEFESLFKYIEEFNGTFYDTLDCQPPDVHSCQSGTCQGLYPIKSLQIFSMTTIPVNSKNFPEKKAAIAANICQRVSYTGCPKQPALGCELAWTWGRMSGLPWNPRPSFAKPKT
jgi:hypothetical protein